MSLFNQPEYYNAFDNPDLQPKGNLVVGLVGADGSKYVPPPAPVPANKTTSTTLPCRASNQAVTLNAPSGRINIKVDDAAGTSNAYVTFDGTVATTVSFRVDAGGSYLYEGQPITEVNVICDGTSGTFSILAE